MSRYFFLGSVSSVLSFLEYTILLGLMIICDLLISWLGFIVPCEIQHTNFVMAASKIKAAAESQL